MMQALVGEPLRRFPLVGAAQSRVSDTPLAMIKSNEKKLSLPHEGLFSLFCSFFSLFSTQRKNRSTDRAF
jgi:hypothetical protein